MKTNTLFSLVALAASLINGMAAPVPEPLNTEAELIDTLAQAKRAIGNLVQTYRSDPAKFKRLAVREVGTDAADTDLAFNLKTWGVIVLEKAYTPEEAVVEKREEAAADTDLAFNLKTWGVIVLEKAYTPEEAVVEKREKAAANGNADMDYVLSFTYLVGSAVKALENSE